MAAQYDFPKIVKGDTFKSRKIKILKDGSPLNLTGATICMQLKIYPGHTEVHSFANTISNASAGEITLSDWKVDLPVRTYNYDLKITLGDGSILTYIKGIFPVTQNISECQ